jgi:hypothetical protein
MPARVDWLARRQGSVIDFRLPVDRYDIPSAVMRARIAEYYRQLWASQGFTPNRSPPEPTIGDLFGNP